MVDQGQIIAKKVIVVAYAEACRMRLMSADPFRVIWHVIKLFRNFPSPIRGPALTGCHKGEKTNPNNQHREIPAPPQPECG